MPIAVRSVSFDLNVRAPKPGEEVPKVLPPSPEPDPDPVVPISLPTPPTYTPGDTVDAKIVVGTNAPVDEPGSLTVFDVFYITGFPSATAFDVEWAVTQGIFTQPPPLPSVWWLPTRRPIRTNDIEDSRWRNARLIVTLPSFAAVKAAIGEERLAQLAGRVLKIRYDGTVWIRQA